MCTYFSLLLPCKFVSLYKIGHVRIKCFLFFRKELEAFKGLIVIVKIFLHSSESKWHQISSGLHNSSRYFKKVVIYMVLILPIIFYSSIFFSNSSGTDCNTPTIKSIMVIHNGVSFLYSLTKSQCLFIFLFFYVSKQQKTTKKSCLLFYSLRVFHISVSRWAFTGVWVTTSFFKSLGIFSVFWPISSML